MTFTKTYDGTGEVKHAVEYKGQLAADGKLTGTWEIPNAIHGTFTAEKPAAEKPLGGGLWHGGL